jgi:hypothetical protein
VKEQAQNKLEKQAYNKEENVPPPFGTPHKTNKSRQIKQTMVALGIYNSEQAIHRKQNNQTAPSRHTASNR